MKFLLLSLKGDGLALARRLQDNGHTVAAWVRDGKYKQNFEGLVNKIDRWENFLDKETVVFFDATGGGKIAERLKAKGQKVLLGSVFADQLESDRDVAFNFMEEVGIKFPKTEHFSSWEDGRKYAKEHEGRLVFKPSGLLAKRGDEQGISSYVAYDPEDMVDMLTYFESLARNTSPEYELQDFIDNGVAISTEGWFNGREFMHPFNHTVERKQLMDKNLGPSGGCAGNSVWAAERNNHIIEEGIARIAPVLQQFQYIGPIDLNTICTPDGGVWALEFTPRFGYDALPAFLELYEGDVGELFYKLASKEEPKEMVLKSGFSSGLRLSVPPYPSEEYKPKGGVPVSGFTKEDRPHLFFYEVMLNNYDKLVTSGSGGTVVTITGHGESIAGSFWPIMELAEKARIPDKQYRTDLIQVLSEDYGRWQSTVQERMEKVTI